MKVLVLGSKGSMGRRYCAILEYLGIHYFGIDKEDEKYDYNIENGIYDKHKFTHAIIATPTEYHGQTLRDFCLNIPHVLCEKPVSKQSSMIEWMRDYHPHVNMVCNWKYAIGNPKPGTHDIRYSNYNTGKDGLGWDCIQLIYLARNIKISTETPFFECMTVDPECNCEKLITLSNIENSYIQMIEHWLGLNGKENDLWDLNDALKATEKVLEWNKKNG